MLTEKQAVTRGAYLVKQRLPLLRGIEGRGGEKRETASEDVRDTTDKVNVEQ